MASSPPKRRKTSPTTSIPVDATPQPQRPSVTDSPHTAPGRASFLSPTKASLARFNPGLLERPKSAGGERPQSRGGEGGPSDSSALEIPTATNGVGKEAANGRDEASSAADAVRGGVGEQNGGKSPSPSATVISPGRTTRSRSKQGLRASPRRRSRTPAVSSSPSKEMRESLAVESESVALTVQENGGAQSPPEGDSDSNVMKALQALAQMDEADDEWEAREPVKALQVLTQVDETNNERETEESEQKLQTRARLDQKNDKLGAEGPEKAPPARAQPDKTNDEREAEEPELPPMPPQMGLPDPVVSRPPAGLLNTPGKRARKNRALGEALASSPIKPRPTRRAITSPTKDLVPRPRVQNPGQGLVRTRSRRRESSELAEQDGKLSSKRRKRDDLRAQLQKLQDEVAAYEKQVELEREAPGGGRPPIDPANEQDRRKIISLLLKSNDRSLSPPKPPRPSSLSLLNDLLPFSKTLPPHTATPSPPSPQGPIPSHRPIDLANPLPYLSLFTPLTFASTTALLQSSDTSATHLSTSPTPIHQHHLIKAHSTQHLLTATISLTVNTSSLHVSDLQITALSPWAESELGAWIHERASRRGVEGRDIAGVCWAMGRYWEMASRRAKCWWRCEMRFRDLLVGGGDGRRKGGGGKETDPPHQHNNKKGGEGKQQHTGIGNNDGDDDVHGPQPTRRDLMRYLGRTSLRFQRGDVELVIKWTISFDWTGEAESAVVAVTRAPSAWNQADERNSLSKIPEAFDGLVRDRGVFAAVGAVVGLLFP